jgi:uncharacterized phiE125 gp8 family phage protein
MAIQNTAIGGGALLYPAGLNLKPALTGASGGLWWGWWISLPASGMANNTLYSFIVRDAGNDGTFNGTTDAAFFIGGDSSSQGTSRMRPAWRSAAGSSVQQTTDSYRMTSPPQMARSTPYLVVIGVVNTGTTGSPVWQNFITLTEANGTPIHELMPQGTNFSTWLGASTGLINRIFTTVNTFTNRSPANTIVEHVAVGAGNFPWDAANSRPDYDVLTDLAAGTVVWDDASVLNGGSLRDWRKLANNTDLNDYSPLGNGALTVEGTVADASPIAPGLWQGSSSIVIDERAGGHVFGGRGGRTQSFTGTYSGGVTALQFRVERNTGTIASPVWTLVSGYDWQTAGGTLGSGVWSFSLPGTGLPVGANYRIRVRDATLTATEGVTTARWHVGTVCLLHGQSQMQRAEEIGRGIRAPISGMACSVARVEGGGRSANSSGSYIQPVINTIDLTSAGATGGGYMAMASAWWQATGEPIMFLDMTIEGSGLSQWNNNDTYNTPNNNFNYRGDGTSPPLVGSANGSGVMTMFALFSGRYRDVDLFNWGTSDSSAPNDWTGKMATYRGHLATYFSNSTSAPMVIFPYPRSNGGGAWPFPLNLRNIQRDYAKTTANTICGPDMLDIIMDNDGSNHQRGSITDGTGTTREIAGEGAQRLGLTMGRGLAVWATSGAVALGAPVATAAVFTSPTRNILEIECGQTLRTENSAALAQMADVSTDSGTSWGRSGFTATLSGTKLRLTKDSGSWPTGTTRVRYLEEMPFQSLRENTEAAAVSLVDGLVYGPAQSWRDGRGMHMQPTGPTGLLVAESNSLVPVPGSVALVGGSGTLAISFTPVPVAASINLLGGAADLAGGAPLLPWAGSIGLVGGTAAVGIEYTITATAGAVALRAGTAVVQFLQPEDPGLAPISLSEAKAYLRVDTDDEDALISDLIRAAATKIEGMTGIVCRSRTVYARFTSFGPRMPLRRGPAVSIDAVDYLDADGAPQALALDQVALRSFAGAPVMVAAPGVSLPVTDGSDGNGLVTFTAGYAGNAQADSAVRTAARILVAHWFDNRSGEQDTPQQVIDLLAPLRLADI